jgi:hypothetical protein
MDGRLCVLVAILLLMTLLMTRKGLWVPHLRVLFKHRPLRALRSGTFSRRP